MSQSVGFTGTRCKPPGMTLIEQIIREKNGMFSRLIERTIYPYRPVKPPCPRCHPFLRRRQAPSGGGSGA